MTVKAEELDDRKVQIVPPGFHVIFLPFADDFRKLKLDQQLPRGRLLHLFCSRNYFAVCTLCDPRALVITHRDIRNLPLHLSESLKYLHKTPYMFFSSGIFTFNICVNCRLSFDLCFLFVQPMPSRLRRQKNWSRSYSLLSAASRLRIPCCSSTTPALRRWLLIETPSKKSATSPVCTFNYGTV